MGQPANGWIKDSNMRAPSPPTRERLVSYRGRVGGRAHTLSSARVVQCPLDTSSAPISECIRARTLTLISALDDEATPTPLHRPAPTLHCVNGHRKACGDHHWEHKGKAGSYGPGLLCLVSSMA